MCINNIDFCQRLKKEYYVKNIKMLYSWSRMTEDEIFETINALGLFDHIDAIKWLLTNKARLDAEININIGIFANENQTKNEKLHALDRLKIALIICNKTQAIKILSSIVLYSNNPKEYIENIETL